MPEKTYGPYDGIRPYDEEMHAALARLRSSVAAYRRHLLEVQPQRVMILRLLQEAQRAVIK